MLQDTRERLYPTRTQMDTNLMKGSWAAVMTLGLFFIGLQDFSYYSPAIAQLGENESQKEINS